MQRLIININIYIYIYIYIYFILYTYVFYGLTRDVMQLKNLAISKLNPDKPKQTSENN